MGNEFSVTMTLRAALLLSLLALTSFGFEVEEGDYQDSEGSPPPPPPQVVEKDYSKMRVKQLRALLKERGVECKGCLEKEHIVARVKETIHLPVLQRDSPRPPPGAEVPLMDKDAILARFREQEKQQEQMKEKLRASGIDTSGMSFGGGMTPEMMEAMQKSFQGQNKGEL